jgi:ubiquinone/menaquinone biosynthesis C-methylase UbiE
MLHSCPVGLRKSLFAAMYDRMSRSSEDAGLRDMRHGLLAEAGGRILEIGGGTGANLPHYGEALESLVLTEPDPAMLRRLRRKTQEQSLRAEILQAPAEDLPFDDESFDTVVSTLVLCGVDNQARALSEARRVLRPGGKLLFIEHVRSNDAGVARLQDRISPLNRFLFGCDCNRQTLSMIEQAGFTVARVEQTELPKAPKFVRPSIVGSASV